MRLVSASCNLAVIYPRVAEEWHPIKNAGLTPKDVLPYSRRKVWWRCAKGHEWQALVGYRARTKYCCPYCSGRRAAFENCLATVNPALAAEWHPTKNAGLTPKDITLRASKKVWWHCSKGHSYQAMVSSRAKGSSCPYCRSHVASEDCLATLRPDLAKEWHPTKNTLRPRQVTKGSGKKVWWKCKKGHVWQARILDRTINGSSCPYCTNRKVCKDNCLAAVNPAIASQWHPTKNGRLTPKQVIPGTNRKVWWLGKCGHSWEAVIFRRNKGRGCPRCSWKKRIGKK